MDKTPYAYSKYGGEVEIWRGMQEGLNAVIVNPGIILGKGSPIEKLLQRDKKGIRWYTPGTKALVGINDVVYVMEKLMNVNISGERLYWWRRIGREKQLHNTLPKYQIKSQK